ncbi:MAG: hypothetical protein ABR549_18760 [Mycobacteriales bacterium]
MIITAIHKISDPAKFWTAAQLPPGVALRSALPNGDGSRGVCLWEAESVETVQQLVDGAFSDVSENEYFEVNVQNAVGLPG